MNVATDVMADVAVRLLTYGELAEALAIKRESARQLVIRKHWERRKGNDGKARIAVPLSALPDPSTRTFSGAGAEASLTPDGEASELRVRISELAASSLRTKLAEVEAELRVRTVELEVERQDATELRTKLAVRTVELEAKTIELATERQRSDELRQSVADWRAQAQSLALTIPSARRWRWKWWGKSSGAS